MNKKTKYILINICDREIAMFKAFDTLDEAKIALKADFEITLKEEGYEANGDDAQLNETSAWLNADYDYDWWIREVE